MKVLWCRLDVSGTVFEEPELQVTPLELWEQRLLRDIFAPVGCSYCSLFCIERVVLLDHVVGDGESRPPRKTLQYSSGICDVPTGCSPGRNNAQEVSV